MSGIAGIFARDGRPVEAHELTPVMDRLAHRGPDGSGVWAAGSVALGHQTLWNTPEAAFEKLPLVRQEGPFAITADARIDNRDELLPVLGLTDRPAREIGDAEFILRAYQKWGAACPEHLVGDFAFAIWDGPQHQVFCARDHLGAKPLLYHLTDTLFAFASEARPLLTHPAVPKRINEGRIADYLVNPLEGIDKTSTFFEEIVKLPPAHRLTVSRESHRFEQYWAPDPTRELHLGSDAEYETAFKAIFTEAVRCRLRSHRPVGVLMSGGIDSESVAGIARSLLVPSGERLKTFSAVRPDEDCAESGAIRTFAELEGVEAETLTPDRFLENVGPLVRHVEGFDDPFDVNLDGFRPALYQAAQASNVSALLDGVDGDLLLGTNWTFPYEWLRRGRWVRTVREIRAFARTFDYPAHILLWKGGVRPALAAAAPPRALAWWHKRHKQGSTLEDILAGTLMDRAFAERVNVVGRMRRFRHHGESTSSHTYSERHASILAHPFLAVALDRYERVAARHGIESRHPLLDKRLVELALSLPFDQKMRAGHRKWILRRITPEVVPETVRGSSRPGEDLSWIFRARWLDREIDSAERLMLQGDGAAAPYLDRERVREAFEAFRTDPAREPVVWNELILTMWIQHIMDSAG